MTSTDHLLDPQLRTNYLELYLIVLMFYGLNHYNYNNNNHGNISGWIYQYCFTFCNGMFDLEVTKNYFWKFMWRQLLILPSGRLSTNGYFYLSLSLSLTHSHTFPLYLSFTCLFLCSTIVWYFLLLLFRKV